MASIWDSSCGSQEGSGNAEQAHESLMGSKEKHHLAETFLAAAGGWDGDEEMLQRPCGAASAAGAAGPARGQPAVRPTNTCAAAAPRDAQAGEPVSPSPGTSKHGTGRAGALRSPRVTGSSPVTRFTPVLGRTSRNLSPQQRERVAASPSASAAPPGKTST